MKKIIYIHYITHTLCRVIADSCEELYLRVRITNDNLIFEDIPTANYTTLHMYIYT
jgi:hypothetical protein